MLWRAIRNIAHGQVFDENFLMALATVGAFGTGEYPEAVFVMLFYQVGELFQSYAVGKSRQSIAALMDIRPDYANVEAEDGQLPQVDPEEVAVGDVIVVKPGERVPLDGVVLEGTSAAGHRRPHRRIRAPGRGARATTSSAAASTRRGLLRVRVTRPFGESTVSKILDLVENASEQKGQGENFITRFARYYTPCVVIAARAVCAAVLALALLPDALPASSRAPSGGLAPPGAHLPGDLLPLRPGDLRAAELFRRHRRRLPVRHPGQGRQLSGGPGPDGDRGL